MLTKEVKDNLVAAANLGTPLTSASMDYLREEFQRFKMGRGLHASVVLFSEFRGDYLQSFKGCSAAEMERLSKVVMRNPPTLAL